MCRVSSYLPERPLTCVFAGLVALAGCDEDTEATLRDRLDRWVSVGPTTYFEHRRDCTAAAFELRNRGFKASLARETNMADALRALARNHAVAFDIPGMTPTEASEHIASSSLPEALGLKGAAVSALNCMSEKLKADYVAALRTPSAVLIFDTTDNAVAVVDFEGLMIYFSGGLSG